MSFKRELDLLQRVQQRAVIGEQRLLRPSVRGLQFGLPPSGVEQRGVDRQEQRADHARYHLARRDLGQVDADLAG
jgi:hypothetical protein